MKKYLALGATTALLLSFVAVPAQAEWRGGGGHGGGGGWHGGHGGGGWHGGGGGWHRGGGGGGWVGPTVLGLGAAAVLGGVIASQAYNPPVYYTAPPPVYYAPPAPPAQPGYWASDGRYYYGNPPCGYGPRC